MKRKTLFIISLIYSILLLLGSIYHLIIGFIMSMMGSGGLILGIIEFIIAVLVFIGAIGIKNNKKYGKILLIITGIITSPLGLIILIPLIIGIED